MARVPTTGNGHCPTEQTLAKLVEELTKRLERGEDVEEFLQAHPREEPHLREMVPAMQILAQCAEEENAIEESLTEALAQVFSGRQPQQQPTPQTLGDFRIVREIGRGGMGVVYLAEQMSLGRQVALKILPLAGMLDPRQLQRFGNEVQAAALLQHSNIVPIYSVGSERGVHFYAMQYVDGHTLAEVIAQLRGNVCDVPTGFLESEDVDGTEKGSSDRQSPRTVPASVETKPLAALSTANSGGRKSVHYRTIAELMIQAATALDHAHSRGVLHRDIKPGNLMVDTTGNLWITDFGLAKLEADAGLTMTGDLIGTLRYMSPEQALAKRVLVDQRTDIYSLGATLYELLTLRPVFDGRDRHELLKQIALEEPRSLRRLDPSVPAELELITLKALEKDPVDRYETAQELADDLQRYLDFRPITAHSPSPLQRVAKWSRRHVGVVWAAVAFMVFFLIMLAVGNVRITKWYREAELQRELASVQLDEARRQEKTATAISDLLLEMLASANPDTVNGTDYTVRELLDDFARGLGDRLADYPEVEAALHATIGNAYRRLSIDDRAEEHLKAAVSLRRKLFGARHPSVADSLVDHAFYLYSRTPRAPYQEIISEAREAIDIYQDCGSEPAKAIKAYSVLLIALTSQVCLETGKFDEFETITAEALALAGDLDSVQIPEVATILHSYARVLRVQGKYVEAEEIARKSVELHRRLHGEDHPETAFGMLHLGDALSSLGRLDEAEMVRREALAVFRRQFDPHHSYVVAATEDVVDTLAKKQDLEGIKSLLKKSVAEIDRYLETHPRCGSCWNRRGEYHRRMEDLETALDDFNQAIQFGSLTSRKNRALVNLQLNHSDEAIKDFQEIVAADSDNANLLNEVAWQLATSPMAVPQYAELALEYAKKACKLTDHKNLMILDTLAAAYAAAGDFDNAVKWSEKSLELLGDGTSLVEFSSHLERFKGGKPWIEEP